MVRHRAIFDWFIREDAVFELSLPSKDRQKIEGVLTES
jgi:hypothetical protein